MCIITTAMTTSILGALGATLASQATATAASIMAIGANALVGAGAIAGIGTGVMSSIQQGKATQAQMNYQAQVNKQNARIAQQNADQKRQEGIEESRLQRMKTIQKVGAQQSALASNGVDISEGTALDIIEDTSAIGELDALTTRYNYETQALAYEQQSRNYKNQASLDILSGQNAYKAGLMNAVGSGIKGLGDTVSVAGNWYNPNSITPKRTGVSGQRVSGGIIGDNILLA